MPQETTVFWGATITERKNPIATLITPSGKREAITPNNGVAFTSGELHALVDGFLECVCLSDGRILWFDEEGKLKGKQPNMVATDLSLDVLIPGDIIVGTAVLTTRIEAGEDEDEQA
jgi:hypothetical protein